MKLTLGDKTYHQTLMGLYRLSIGEGQTIKRQTGMTLADWRLGLITWAREDPDVIAGVVWLMKRRAGEAVSWLDLEQINAQDVIDGLTVEPDDIADVERITALARERITGDTPADEPTPAPELAGEQASEAGSAA